MKSALNLEQVVLSACSGRNVSWGSSVQRITIPETYGYSLVQLNLILTVHIITPISPTRVMRRLTSCKGWRRLDSSIKWITIKLFRVPIKTCIVETASIIINIIISTIVWPVLKWVVISLMLIMLILKTRRFLVRSNNIALSTAVIPAARIWWSVPFPPNSSGGAFLKTTPLWKIVVSLDVWWVTETTGCC